MVDVAAAQARVLAAFGDGRAAGDVEGNKERLRELLPARFMRAGRC